MSTSGFAGKSVFLDEASVMATENVVMAAVLAEGETVIGNAACEPHVQDLCRFLVSLGAQIDGIESNVLRIQGVTRSAAARGASRRSTSRSGASSASPRAPGAI
jgi:UDP-N-acetylglucosamine 1-carboxyvinyltransferase